MLEVSEIKKHNREQQQHLMMMFGDQEIEKSISPSEFKERFETDDHQIFSKANIAKFEKAIAASIEESPEEKDSIIAKAVEELSPLRKVLVKGADSQILTFFVRRTVDKDIDGLEKGVYADTAENRKKGRVGASYGKSKKESKEDSKDKDSKGALSKSTEVKEDEVFKIKEDLVYSESYGGLMTASGYKGSDAQRTDEDSGDKAEVYLKAGESVSAGDDGKLGDVTFFNEDESVETTLNPKWISR